MTSKNHTEQTDLSRLIRKHADRWEEWQERLGDLVGKLPNASEVDRALTGDEWQQAYEELTESRLPCKRIDTCFRYDAFRDDILNDFQRLVEAASVPPQPELIARLIEIRESCAAGVLSVLRMAADKNPSTHAHLLTFVGIELPRLIGRLRHLADLIQQQALDPGLSEEWSKPMSKQDIATALHLSSVDKLNAMVKHGSYVIRQVVNRQTWQIRLDTVPKELHRTLT